MAAAAGEGSGYFTERRQSLARSSVELTHTPLTREVSEVTRDSLVVTSPCDERKTQMRESWPPEDEFVMMLSRINRFNSSCEFKLPANDAVEKRGYRLKTAKFQKTIIKIQKMVELSERAAYFQMNDQLQCQEAQNLHNAFEKIVDDLNELFRYVPTHAKDPLHPLVLTDTSPFCQKSKPAQEEGEGQEGAGASLPKTHPRKPCIYKVLYSLMWYTELLTSAYHYSRHCLAPKQITLEILDSLNTLLNSKQDEEWPRALMLAQESEESKSKKKELFLLYIFFSGGLQKLLTLTTKFLKTLLKLLHTLAAEHLVEQWYQEHIVPNNKKPRKSAQTISARNLFKVNHAQSSQPSTPLKSSSILEEAALATQTPQTPQSTVTGHLRIKAEPVKIEDLHMQQRYSFQQMRELELASAGDKRLKPDELVTEVLNNPLKKQMSRRGKTAEKKSRKKLDAKQKQKEEEKVNRAEQESEMMMMTMIHRPVARRPHSHPYMYRSSLNFKVPEETINSNENSHLRSSISSSGRSSINYVFDESIMSYPRNSFQSSGDKSAFHRYR